MIEETEARRRILDSVAPGAAMWLPLDLAGGHVLAQSINGVADSPVFDNSSMDGYAVRAAEAQTGAQLKVAEIEQPAGLDKSLELNAGEAIRIFTGAPIPQGADAVIMQEDVNREGDRITIVESVVTGENIRRRGGDVCAGQLLLNRGTELTPSRIGLLASQGIPEIPVFGRPLVQIVITGDELVEPGTPLFKGEIYNSNGPMLKAAVERANGVSATNHAQDDMDDLGHTLESALLSGDIVVVAGGVSVGERDYVKDVLNSLGVITDFWRVNVKPGKPFLFGTRTDGTTVFGLPGNPVSAFVTFSLFVLPAIRRFQGFEVEPDFAGTGKIQGVAAEAMSNRGDRPHYLRCIQTEEGIRMSGTQQSHAIFALSRADCLVRLRGGEEVPPGGKVTAYLI